MLAKPVRHGAGNMLRSSLALLKDDDAKTKK
jgi:hypothetical protein